MQQVSVLGAIDIDGLPKAARRLLAVLALRAGRLVRIDEAIDALWGDQPPPTARKSLQNQVVRLRQRLGPDAITTEPDGYRLLAPTDAPEFERLARTSPETALAMWRGDPFPELDDWLPAAAERSRLIEINLSSQEAAAERRLDVAEAQRLVDEQPLRERRWCVLLRALYDDGRQADALRAAQRARAVLGELGLEPGPELRAVEAAIARHDSEAAPHPPAVAAADSLRFGREAHAAGDHMLAMQWLRFAGPGAEARLGLARAAFAAGDSATGLEAIGEVVDRAVVVGDAATALEALVSLTAGRGPSVMTPAIAQLFERVDLLADALDGDQRATLAACRAFASAYSVGREQLAVYIDRAHCGQPASARTTTLVQLCDVLALDRPHDAERRLAAASGIDECGDPDLDQRAAFLGRHGVLWSLLELGEPTHVRARTDLLTAAAATRHAVDRAGAAVWGSDCMVAGDVAGAERDAIEWLGPLASHEGPGVAMQVHVSYLFTIRWMQGRLPELIPMLEVGAAAMPTVPTWRSALAMAYATAGRLDDAGPLLDDFVRDGRLDLDVGFGLWSATVFHLVNAALALDSNSAIDLLIEEITPIPSRHAFYGCHHLGVFAHHLGALHAARGEPTMARDHLRAAVAAHESLGSRWWTARSRGTLAAL